MLVTWGILGADGLFATQWEAWVCGDHTVIESRSRRRLEAIGRLKATRVCSPSILSEVPGIGRNQVLSVQNLNKRNFLNPLHP